jgi:hypothetical protein
VRAKVVVRPLEHDGAVYLQQGLWIWSVSSTRALRPSGVDAARRRLLERCEMRLAQLGVSHERLFPLQSPPPALLQQSGRPALTDANLAANLSLRDGLRQIEEWVYASPIFTCWSV